MLGFQIAISVVGLVLSLGSLLCSVIQCFWTGQDRLKSNNDTQKKTETSKSYNPEDEPFPEFNDTGESSSGDKTEE